MQRNIGSIFFGAIVVVGTLLMLRLSLPYLAIKPGIDFLQTKSHIYHILHWRLSFYVHVFSAIFVLAAGLVQFNSYILRRYKQLHRFAGYIYVGCVLLVSGPSGLVMGFYANGGLPAKISFVLLACLWMFTTGLALRRALQQDFAAHRRWMMRSYALTLSAITLRTYALLIGLLNIDIRPTAAYILISWLSWTVNLVVAEVLIWRVVKYTKHKGHEVLVK